MSQENEKTDGRRDVSSRNTKWAHKTAVWLTKHNVTPNSISVTSVIFAAIGGGILLSAAFQVAPSFYLIFSAYIVCILGRLLCNLFDGMVAIEGGKKSDNGDLFNDIPDRFADAFLIIPAGYVAGGFAIELAWLAALLAVMTAYVRWLGAYVKQKHFFNGPMAKQHRMALMIAASVMAIVLAPFGYLGYSFLIALIIMNVGLVVTLIRRINFIAQSEKPYKGRNQS